MALWRAWLLHVLHLPDCVCKNNLIFSDMCSATTRGAVAVRPAGQQTAAHLKCLLVSSCDTQSCCLGRCHSSWRPQSWPRSCSLDRWSNSGTLTRGRRLRGKMPWRKGYRNWLCQLGSTLSLVCIAAAHLSHPAVVKRARLNNPALRKTFNPWTERFVQSGQALNCTWGFVWSHSERKSSVQISTSDNGIFPYLTSSPVFLTGTNHVACDICILHRGIAAAALAVSDDRNLNLLQWESTGQRHCRG